MIIKKRGKISKKLFYKKSLDKFDKNFVYWIEDNTGKKVSKNFTIDRTFEVGPFIVLYEPNNYIHIIFKDPTIDTFYLHGNYSIEQLNNLYCIHSTFDFDNDLLFNSKGTFIKDNFTLKTIDYSIDCMFIYEGNSLKFIKADSCGLISDIVTIPNLVEHCFDSISGVKHSYKYTDEFIGIFDDNTKALISASGTLLSNKLHYNKIYPLNHNFFFVENHTGIGLVDSEGNVIIEPFYSYAKPVSFNPNWIIVKDVFYYKVIDITGKIIIDSEESEIIDKNSKLIVQKDIILFDLYNNEKEQNS